MTKPRSAQRLATEESPPHLVCVYRRHNARHVLELVEATTASRGTSHLWALDQTSPALSDWTVGSGAGSRLALLNLLARKAAPTGPLIVADDDVSFSHGDLATLLAVVRLARLDLAQPAHDRESLASHAFTHRKRHSIARRTTFVEVGPLVVIAERLRSLITPFPEEFGMGWGLDVVWSDLARQGFRLGIVDRVAITHHGKIGAAYDMGEAHELLATVLDARGLHDVKRLHRTIATWSARGPHDPRQHRPVWLPSVTRQSIPTPLRMAASAVLHLGRHRLTLLADNNSHNSPESARENVGR